MEMFAFSVLRRWREYENFRDRDGSHTFTKYGPINDHDLQTFNVFRAAV